MPYLPHAVAAPAFPRDVSARYLHDLPVGFEYADECHPVGIKFFQAAHLEMLQRGGNERFGKPDELGARELQAPALPEDGDVAAEAPADRKSGGEGKRGELG